MLDENTSEMPPFVPNHGTEDAMPEFIDPGKNELEAQKLVGEFEAETPPGENEEFAPEKMPAEMSPLPITENLKKIIVERINCLKNLDALEAARQEFIVTSAPEDSVKGLLATQAAEMKALPTLAAIREKQTALVSRIKTARVRFANPPEGVEIKPETIAHTEQAWRFAAKQYEILSTRGKLTAQIVSVVGAEYCPKEPLFVVCKQYGYPAERAFAFAVYQLGLEEWVKHLNEERKSLQGRLNELTAQKSLNPFGHKKEHEEQDKIKAGLEQLAQTMALFSREIASLQKNLLEEYWKLYEFAACLYISPKPSANQAAVLRALLRFGLLGHAPYFISPRSLQFIRHSCVNDVALAYDYKMGASHVMYADEYLRFVADGDISASIDENLELSGRQSPEWHNDKALRRLAFSRARKSALLERCTTLETAIGVLRDQQVKMEDRKSKLIHNDKDFKKKNAELAQKIQHCKVEAARFERVMERINSQEIPLLDEKTHEAHERLEDSPVKVSRYASTRKEVAAVHRVCRLCARLKDTFPPFSLRDYFRPENKTVNDRPTVQAMLKEIEECDRYIFQDILVNSRKAAQRITLRFHPVLLLAPNYGFLGYSWNPRAGMETGKLVFPLYCPRQGIAARVMYNMLADFQWDTSKAAAGVDLLTSDTLVAAYAGVRWDYRKRKRENREKALIFNEINDRQNWRRHYELYLESAKDSGRKLFFKNPEVYEVVVKYLGLPPGCEKLRH